MSESGPGRRVGLVAGVLLGVLFVATGILRQAGTDDRTAGPGERLLTVDLDLDFDGRNDRVTLRGPDDGHADWTITAVLADRTKVKATLAAADVAAWPVDVGQDHRQELLVRTGRGTWTTGSLLVLHDGELRPALRSDTNEDYFGWGAHSNCCPGGTADVACGAASGGPNLVITSSQLVSPAWDGRYPIVDPDPFGAFSAEPRRRVWEGTIYRLDGATLLRIFSDRGVNVGDERGPANMPMHNALNCDAAQD